MLENVELVNIIRKGGDLNYILYEISNFYDINTKRNFDVNKFIKNYLGILLERFNIDEVKIFVDEDLRTVDKDIDAYHYLGDIYINSNFFKIPSEFFSDLLVLTHEFSHLIDYDKTFKLVRKVNENNMRLKLVYNSDILYDLGMVGKNYYEILYKTNECEYTADQFAYDYVLDLIEKSKKFIKQNCIEQQLLRLAGERISNTRKIKESIYEKYQNEFMPDIIEHVKKVQNKWYLYLEDSLEELENSKDKIEQEKIMDFIVKRKLKIDSTFTIYENFEILKKMQDLSFKYAKNSSFNTFLYLDCINYFNYVVNDEDIKNISNLLESINFSLALSEIGLNQQNLKEYLIKAKYKNYDKEFEKYTNISNFKDYKSLMISYKKFLKTKKIDKIKKIFNLER